MGYVAVAIVVLLVVAVGVTFFVLSATRRQRPAAIVAPDEQSPVGDTDQHAEERTEGGRARAGGSAGGEGGLGGEAEASRGDLSGNERTADRPR
jgi:hypothetical protein